MILKKRLILFFQLKSKLITFNHFRNYIQEEKESIKKSSENYKKFKETYLKQKRHKKEELKKLYAKVDDKDNFKQKKDTKNENKIIDDDKNYLQIEFSNGKIIKEDIQILTKFPSSILSASINGKISLPKRNGHIFFDRNYDDFNLILHYLKKSKLPKFKNKSEEQKFFKEIDFWQIPMKSYINKPLQFDLLYTPACFKIDNNCTVLKKENHFHGITLLNRALTALTPYAEFTIFFNNLLTHNKNFFFGLVDKKKFSQNDINKSFNDGSAPFIFYWDIFKNKIIKTKNGNLKEMEEFDKSCRCYMNNYVIKLGMRYNQREHSVTLYRDDIELNIEIGNVEQGMIPAIELHLVECKIILSPNNEKQEIIYL